MKYEVLFFFLAMCILPTLHGDGCASTRYLGPTVSAAHGIVPAPRRVEASHNLPPLQLKQESFKMVATLWTSILDSALDRYRAIIFTPCWGEHLSAHPVDKFHAQAQCEGPLILRELRVTVWSTTEVLAPDMDEAYNLTINLAGGEDAESGLALITANTVWGALRGLETFSQIVQCVPTTHEYHILGAPWLVEDSPRFRHRGLLVDTSRHFLPVGTLFKIMDSMQYSKLNVLHWHIVDAQSYPAPSVTTPNLTLGAYSVTETYSMHDLASIGEYGRQRGIRVVPEVDSPGHTAAMAAGVPEIVVCTTQTREDGYCAENPCGQLDPSMEDTFEVMNGIVQDITSVLNDAYFHCGADEFVDKCWSEDSGISTWMREKNFTTTEAFGYYVNRIAEIVQSHSRTPMYWDEVWLQQLNVPLNSVIQVWHSQSLLQDVISSGYSAVLSNYDAWYLDCGIGGNWCPYCTWEDMLLNDPVTVGISIEQEKLILGGEVCMWGELVDFSNIEGVVWPRAAAVAERLWSEPSKINATHLLGEFYTRLKIHRCRMVRRGIRASPLEPGSSVDWCNDTPQ